MVYKKIYKRYKQRTKRRHTRRNIRRHTRKHKGGVSYKNPTTNIFEGVAYKDDAVVDVEGFGTMTVKAFKAYINNKELHGHF